MAMSHQLWLGAQMPSLWDSSGCIHMAWVANLVLLAHLLRVCRCCLHYSPPATVDVSMCLYMHMRPPLATWHDRRISLHASMHAPLPLERFPEAAPVLLLVPLTQPPPTHSQFMGALHSMPTRTVDKQGVPEEALRRLVLMT